MNNLLKIIFTSVVLFNNTATFANPADKATEVTKQVQFKTEPVAVINGEKILEAKVAESFDKNLQYGYNKSYLDLPSDVKDKVVQTYVNNILFLKEAKKLKLEDNVDFQSKLAALKEELLLSSVFESYLKDKISEEDIKKKYDELVIATKGSFEVKFSFIQLNSEKAANDVLSKLKEKQSFAVLAKKFSLDTQTKDQGGSIKEFVPLKAIPAFEVGLMKLKIGGVSSPIHLGEFWYVVKLDDKKLAELPPFDEMKISIQNGLRSIELKKVIADLTKEYNVEFTNSAVSVSEESGKTK